MIYLPPPPPGPPTWLVVARVLYSALWMAAWLAGLWGAVLLLAAVLDIP